MCDSKKLYLSEELNVSKMFDMFKQKYPGDQISYETYRISFNTKFNISFGYPRTDTCDKYTAKVKKLGSVNRWGRTTAVEDRKWTTQKASTGILWLEKTGSHVISKNQRKRSNRYMDYQKNISLLNVSTNDVYYRRQLSMYSFNVHTLSLSRSVFFTYPEYVGKKGLDEVSSFSATSFFIIWTQMWGTFVYSVIRQEVKIKITLSWDFFTILSPRQRNWTQLR